MSDDAVVTNEIESRVRALEMEFQKATERSMLAKKAVKDAKALAKAAKKEKRSARKALIAAQEEHAAALLAAEKTSKSKSRESKSKPGRKIAAAGKVRIADSPETNPHSSVARKRKARSKQAADAPTSVTPVEPAATEPATALTQVSTHESAAALEGETRNSANPRD